MGKWCRGESEELTVDCRGCKVRFHPYMITESQNHRITEWQGLEGTYLGHLVQPPCRSRVAYSRLHRTLSRWVKWYWMQGLTL